MVRIPIPFLKLTRCAPIAVPLSVSTVIFAYICTHVTAQTPSSGHPYASTYTFLCTSYSQQYLVRFLSASSTLCASYQPAVPCALPISQQYLVRFLSASSTLCASYQPAVPCVLPISQQYLVRFLSASSTLCASYQPAVPCALPISQQYLVRFLLASSTPIEIFTDTTKYYSTEKNEVLKEIQKPDTLNDPTTCRRKIHDKLTILN